MKFRAMIVTGLLLTLSVCAVAQDATTPAAGGRQNRQNRQGGQQMDRVGPAVKDLGLSEAQIQSIKDIVTKYRTDSRTIMQGTEEQSAKQTKMDALKPTATTGIKAVLTEAKVDAAKQDEVVAAILSSGRGGRNGAPGATTPPPAVTPPAGRNAYQGRGNFGIMGMLQQLNLTAEQRTAIDDINKASQAKLTEDVKAKLTEEQKTKLDELMKARTTPAPRN